VINSAQEHGHSEMKNFEKEKTVTGEGDIRQDILAQEKKEEQGAFVAGSRNP
jgi:hypothetical protein